MALWSFKRFQVSLIILLLVPGCAPNTPTNSPATQVLPVDHPTSASVVVYQPMVRFRLGGIVNQPTIDTSVEAPNQQPATLTTSTLTVQVSLHANTEDITFQPVTLHVDGDAGNPRVVHNNIPVTTSPLHLNKGQDKDFKITIPVPSYSGAYTVMADSPTFNPVYRKALENFVYVDHGGFYQSGLVQCNIHQQHGDVGITITQVNMTSKSTIVQFYLTGSPTRYQVSQWGDMSRQLQQVVPSSGYSTQLVGTENQTAEFGAMPSSKRECEWYADPTRSDATALKFTLELLVLKPQSPARDIQSFVINIPLAKQPRT